MLVVLVGDCNLKCCSFVQLGLQHITLQLVCSFRMPSHFRHDNTSFWSSVHIMCPPVRWNLHDKAVMCQDSSQLGVLEEVDLCVKWGLGSLGPLSMNSLWI